MPEENTLAISADQFAALPPASQTALAAQLEKAGYSAEQIAKLGGKAPAASAAKSPALPLVGSSTAPASPVVSSREGSGLSYEQRVDAFKRLQAAGVDPERVAEAAHVEGIDPKDLQAMEAAPAARLTLDEANARLAQQSGPFASSQSPADFSFQFAPEHVDGLEPDQVADIDGMFRDAFHVAGVPVSVGSALVRELMASGAKFADMDDAQRVMAFREEGAKLQRMGNAAQIEADCRYAYERLPKDFRDVIDEQQLMHSADAFLAMANAGAAMRQRDSRK